MKNNSLKFVKGALVLGAMAVLATGCGTAEDADVSAESSSGLLESDSTLGEKTELVAPSSAAERLAEAEQKVVDEIVDEVESGAENGANTEKQYETYEFETYEGKKVTIDASNIVSQEEVIDVLETTQVPEDAVVIAPGRDYVYLEDANYYYVEDATKNLLTIATKGGEAETTAATETTGAAETSGAAEEGSSSSTAEAE